MIFISYFSKIQIYKKIEKKTYNGFTYRDKVGQYDTLLTLPLLSQYLNIFLFNNSCFFSNIGNIIDRCNTFGYRDKFKTL